MGTVYLFLPWDSTDDPMPDHSDTDKYSYGSMRVVGGRGGTTRKTGSWAQIQLTLGDAPNLEQMEYPIYEIFGAESMGLFEVEQEMPSVIYFSVD